MRADILSFIRLAHKKIGPLEAAYIPADDLYIITKNGKSVQNFTSKLFYQVPRYFRLNEWRAMIRVGMNHNMGEKNVVDQLSQVKNVGKKILL